MKVQNLRKLLSLDERPATGLNLPQISLNAEATQISKRICRNSGRGQVVCGSPRAAPVASSAVDAYTTVFGLRAALQAARSAERRKSCKRVDAQPLVRQVFQEPLTVGGHAPLLARDVGLGIAGPAEVLV